MEETTLDLRDLLKIIKTRKWIIICTTLFCIILGLVVSFIPQKTNIIESNELYKSTASIVIGTFPDLESDNIKDINILNQQIVKTYGTVAASRTVTEKTINELNLDIETDDFKNRIIVLANADTQVITVHYIDKEEGNQQEILDVYVKNFIQEAQNTYPTGKLKILDEPSQVEMIKQDDFLVLIGAKKQDATNLRLESSDLTQENPRNKKLILAISMFLGIMLGVGVTFIVEYMDNTLKKKEEAEEIFKLPTLSIIPYDNIKERENVEEAFRTLRANLQLKNQKIFTVTSASKEDGKTIVSVNLAKVFAEANFKTLIIDGNGRDSKVNEAFNLENTKGISDILYGMISNEESLKKENSSLIDVINSVLVNTNVEKLNVLSWGNEKLNPADLLSKSNVGELLQELKNNFDYIIIDTTSMVNYCDAQAFSKASDGTLIVAAERNTDRNEMLRMKELVDISGIDARGLVWRADKF